MGIRIGEFEMTATAFNARHLQRDFFVKSKKGEEKGMHRGFVSWEYRLRCRHCKTLSKMVTVSQKGIPTELKKWAANHNCKAKKVAKRSKEKDEPG